jgi:hypothetical protein
VRPCTGLYGVVRGFQDRLPPGQTPDVLTANPARDSGNERLGSDLVSQAGQPERCAPTGGALISLYTPSPEAYARISLEAKLINLDML